jgi:osomolarity two-component system, response regulator SSK1
VGLVLIEPTPDQEATGPVGVEPVSGDPVPAPTTAATAEITMKPPYKTDRQYSSESSNMSLQQRKVWVKRGGAAPTLVLVRPEDLVDEVKEMILRRYGNSLGKHFDAPDVTLKLVPREQQHLEHVLNPDEILWEALDKAYPGGQKMDEALIVNVPHKRTPRHSPGGHLMHSGYYSHADDGRPHENGTDYFPPMPPAGVSPGGGTIHDPRLHLQDSRAISVLTTGQLPPLVSPGGTRRPVGSRQNRPNFVRNHTASPTPLTASTVSRPNRPRMDSAGSDKHPPPLVTAHPTPPIVETKVTPKASPRLASPRGLRNRKSRKNTSSENGNATPTLPPSFIDTAVPPINILIVEDNMINMKLLEQFVRRLKVHWATAVNGREAVEKWRQGGFHLVLMDIQLPIMSGLEATREIRRLERINHIGVLTGSSHSSVPPDAPFAEETKGEVKDEDKLEDSTRLFKSPVIIVALTASNLQSDRHEALAAGCNDFLTKVCSYCPAVYQNRMSNNCSLAREFCLV